jgi:hypothetical protein
VALLDADDLFLPDHLARLERGFDSAPESVLCFGDAEVFTARGVTRPSFIAGTRLATVPTELRDGGIRLMTESAFSSLLWGSYIPTAATVFLRSAALSVGLYDERFRTTEDREFLLRLSRLGRFSYYPNVVARKREHGANLTSPSRALEFVRSQFRVLCKVREAAQELALSPEELGNVHQAIADQVSAIQYVASTRGPRAYAKACLFLAQCKVFLPIARPWPLLRALARPILHPLQRRDDDLVPALGPLGHSLPDQTEQSVSPMAKSKTG